MLTSTILSLALLAGGNGNVSKEEMTSTPEEFQEYATLMTGRWLLTTTATVNYPEVGIKKGDEVTLHYKTVPVADGQGLLTYRSGPKGAGTRLLRYDTGKKQIVSMGVSTTGAGSSSVVWKVGKNKYRVKVTGSTPTGAPASSLSEQTFEDNGRTISVKQISLTRDGEKGEQRTIKVNKLSK